MTLSTTRCSHFGHPEISVKFEKDTVVSDDVEWLVTYLQSAVEGGAKFEDGSTIQIGWMIDVFRKESGVLSVWEPDFKNMPYKLVNSVNLTLVHLRLQKSVNESVGIHSYSFPTFDQSGILCDRFVSSEEFMIEREAAADDDSGWFFGCSDARHDHHNAKNLLRQSLYEIICAKPQLVEFLALPTGAKVSVNDAARVWRDGIELPIHSGSYLDDRRFKI